MTPVRRRWLSMCITADGDFNATAYDALTTRVPLRDFLDIEELGLCERDRKIAWEDWFAKQQGVLGGE